MLRIATLFLFALVTASSTLHAQQAAIRANGIIESGQTGFRFPDGTIQSTAATVTGGVPSVNGIAGAVTIVGNGGNTVSTASGTITVAGPYKRTVIVSPVPNNPTASGTALLNALASITTNSSTNRFLLKIEPGTYDIGANQLVMKSYVDIEGSGQLGTRIESSRGGEDNGDPTDVAAVVGASLTELRDLTLAHTTSGFAGYTYVASNATDVHLSDLTIYSSAAASPIGLLAYGSAVTAQRLNIVIKGQQLAGTAAGALGSSAMLDLRNSTLLVDGGGTATSASGVIVNGGANGTIDSTTIQVGETLERAEGVAAGSGGTVTVTNSMVRAAASPIRRGIMATSSGSNADVHDSRVIVGNVWNDANVVALFRNGGATLRAFSTLTDSASSGAPLCVLTYSYTGTTSCPAPS